MKSCKTFYLSIFMMVLMGNTLNANNLLVNNVDSISSDTVAILQTNNELSNVKYTPTKLEIDSIINPILNALQSDLKLSKEQNVKIKAITENYAMYLLKAKTLTEKDNAYFLMTEITNSFLADLDNILTLKQKEQKEKKFKDKVQNTLDKSNSNTK